MGVCAGRGHLQGLGGMRRLLVFSFLRGGAAEASFGHFHLMAAICDYMSRNASCPRRDDWKSVALPLQSYRSTAAGVSSSAPPPSFLPSRILLSPPFVPHRKVTCCPLLAALGNDIIQQ